MKKVLLSLCIVLMVVVLKAQKPSDIDSLKKELNSSSEWDKFKVYGQISWHYINSSQLDQAKSYSDSLRIYAEKLQDSSGIAYSHFYYGVIDRYTGKYTDALNHLYAFVGYYSSVGDSTKVSHGLFQIGSVYDNLGNYDKAIEVLYRALRIHEQEKDQSSINEAFNNIAIILKKSKQYDESQKMFEKVLLTDSLNTDVLMNLGNLYSEKGALKKAKQYYLKALRIDQENGNERFVAFDLENLGDLFIKMQYYEKALEYASKALQIRLRLPHPIERIYSLKQMGVIYINRNDYPTAKNYLEQAEKAAQAINAKNQLKDIYRNLALVHSKNLNYSKAFKYQEDYSNLNDSLLNKETRQLVNEIKTKYETEKKDQQITLLAQEKQLQEKETQRQATLKNTFIVGTILVLLLAGLLFYTFRQQLKNQKAITSKNEEIKEVNFKRQLAELEMKALQAQINPHFIFNCMNAINQMILDGTNKNAAKYLTKFSKLIRMILENAEETEVSLKNELDMLAAYIQLESLRFEGDVNYEIEIANDLDTENTYLPSMVLQPFVENAIWHGLRHKKDTSQGKISISIAQNDNRLVCKIEDNGVGRKRAFELHQKSVYKSKSMGLKITEDRLRLLSNGLQKQFVKITDLTDKTGSAKGTLVEVLVPIT